MGQKKILITGGAGYIGSHTIVEILDSTDWDLVSVDNYSNSSAETYTRIQEITGKAIQHIEADICDPKALRRVFEKNRFDGIMHFAALKAVGESVEKPLLYYRNNIQGLLNLISMQSEFGVKSHLYSSSCTVYGTPDSLPVTEQSQVGQAESPYGYTKVAGERMLEDISRTGEIRTLALRYFNPVGAHSSGRLGELPLGVPNNLIPFVTQTAAGLRDELTIFGDDYPTRDGSCIRDYIHVTDIALAHISGMRNLLEEKQETDFDFINLGTGKGVSVKEVVSAFEKVNGVPLNYKIGPRRPGDIGAIYADNSKAREILDWQPEFSLEDMMLSAWKWQRYLDDQSL